MAQHHDLRVPSFAWKTTPTYWQVRKIFVQKPSRCRGPLVPRVVGVVSNTVPDIHYESPSGAPFRGFWEWPSRKKTGCWVVRFFWCLMSSSESGHRVFLQSISPNIWIWLLYIGMGPNRWSSKHVDRTQLQISVDVSLVEAISLWNHHSEAYGSNKMARLQRLEGCRLATYSKLFLTITGDKLNQDG